MSAASSGTSVPRLPRAFLEGVRRFNAGRFFEAHEAFEECLDEVESDARWELVLGFVQVAVGYHKCASGHPGGTEMLGRALAKLEPFAGDAGGVDLAALRARIADDRAALARGVTAATQLASPPRLALVASAGWTDAVSR
jgi:uncharacterized protein